MNDSLYSEFGQRHAARRAPRARHAIADVVGQRHLLAPGKPLAVAFASGKPHSMILWGPPGVGQDDARAADGRCVRRRIHRDLGGARRRQGHPRRGCARRGRAARNPAGTTILFVDEVHRFNKAQQDAFLPFVERGLVTFIGATTENPVVRGQQRAAVARSGLRAGAAVGRTTSRLLLDRALRRRDAGCRGRGDRARRADRATPTATAGASSTWSSSSRWPRTKRPRSPIDLAFVEATIARSACAASTRAARRSTTRSPRCTRRCAAPIPDASLYWMCRMLDGGADPLYVGRRLIRMATEDIGLADPRALRAGARRRQRRTSGWARRKASWRSRNA